jgi:hypothetical protein
VVDLNRAFALDDTYQAGPAGQDAVEKATLFAHQKQLNKDLTAAQQVLGRLGGKKKPNQLDVQKLILKEAITVNNTFRGMLDAYRFSVCPAVFLHRFASVPLLTRYILVATPRPRTTSRSSFSEPRYR